MGRERFPSRDLSSLEHTSLEQYYDRQKSILVISDFVRAPDVYTVIDLSALTDNNNMMLKYCTYCSLKFAHLLFERF